MSMSRMAQVSAGMSWPAKPMRGQMARVRAMHRAPLTWVGMFWPPKKGSMNSTRLTRIRVSRKLNMVAGSKLKMFMAGQKQEADHACGQRRDGTA